MRAIPATGISRTCLLIAKDAHTPKLTAKDNRRALGDPGGSFFLAKYGELVNIITVQKLACRHCFFPFRLQALDHDGSV